MKRGNRNDQLMAMAAHRYCLGRMSYIVSACIEWLDLNWSDLDEVYQYIILRDTEEAIDRNEAGMECDKKAWAEFLLRHRPC